MRPSALLPAVALSLSVVAVSHAAEIDMDDPHRALGRENDVRIDAQLIRHTVSPGAPIGVTWQIQNFSANPVAVAERVADASYDEDTRTITLVIGSEVPPSGNLPRMVIVGPGEKRVFRAAAKPLIGAAARRGRLSKAPRYVRIKVAVMRDVSPFSRLIERQDGLPQTLPDALFDKWFASNMTILLNELPVQWTPGPLPAHAGRREPHHAGF